MARNSNGTLKTGTILNPTGRPKGSKNKANADVKEFITCIVRGELSNINSYFNDLEAKDKLDFIVKLLPYVVSKEKEILELETQEIKPITFIEIFNDNRDPDNKNTNK